MFWLWIAFIIFLIMVVIAVLPVANKSRKNLFEIVGEGAYQNNLKNIAGAKTKEAKYLTIMALVESEPNNKHDKNALKVSIEGLTVGYVAKDQALYIASKSKSAICRPVMVIIVGGWKDENSEGNYGVKLFLLSIDDLLG